MWIFGYGSLIWRPGFPYVEASAARLHGYSRRFWQGSPDHRGTPEAPGRVVTLVEEAEARCLGRAFRLDPSQWARVLEELDHREKGGYQRRAVELELFERGHRVNATAYVARTDNPNYLGPAPLPEMARHISRSRGPSGPNDQYLLELADWLHDNDMHDPHVRELARAVRERNAAAP